MPQVSRGAGEQGSRGAEERGSKAQSPTSNLQSPISNPPLASWLPALLPLAFLLLFYFYPLASILTLSFAPEGHLSLAPLGKVKENYENGYEYLSDEDKRLYMREGIVNMTLTINSTSLTQGLKKEITIGWHSYFLMAVIFGLGPISFYEVSRRKKIDKLESRLSDLLRDISESMRAGQTLHEAIKTSAGGE